MHIVEIETTETVDREGAAIQLRRLADLLSGENETIGFERNGMEFSIAVPDQMQLKVELDISADERAVELEIELKW
ncbi:MAG: amphi-Trp domain-containing protein [Actinobacteria bacterium]|nr:amphi-Trp domain-containing protein [Actinomycetota bacterium]